MNQPKKVLITGATGFVGSHLAARLIREGWEVHALVRQNHSGFKPPLEELLSQLKVHALGQTPDDRYSGFVRILKEVQPRAVLHLATHFVGVHQVSDLAPMADSNILFGMQLLEAIQNTVPKTRFVVAGTAWQHYESSAYDPVSLYAATKQAFEDVLKFYRNVCGLDAVVLKLFDSYGAHDYRGKLFHHLRAAAESGKKLEFSPGDQWIDLIYVSDVAAAFMRALDSDLLAGEYAVTSGQAIRLRDMIEVYQRVTGKKLAVEFGARPYRPREMMNPWKIGPVLPGWNPQVSLDQGIRLMEGLS